MKALLWLLDINYELVGDNPEIRLWGIDGQNNRVLVIDRSFLPYFYLIPKEGKDPGEIAKRIRAEEKGLPELIDKKVLERKYFGRPIKVIKVVYKNPDLTAKYAKQFIKVSGVKDSLEDDIRYSSRYLVDNDIYPCGWHELEAEEIGNDLGLAVGRVLLARSTPKPVEKMGLPKLRVLGFSMISYSKMGAPKPEKDPVVVLSVATNTGVERQFVAQDNKDRSLLEAFAKFLLDFDPDIIVGYGSNLRDWPYLLNRAKVLKLPFTIDRSKTEPHPSLYGHMSVTGRANLDLYDFAEDLGEVKVKTLENVADYLGVRRMAERTLIEETELPLYWEDKDKCSPLLRYSLENTQTIMGLNRVMLDFATQLAYLVGLPLDHVGTAAVGFRVEWYLIRQAHKRGELVPKRVERPYFPYSGAIVLAPKAGVHEEIAVLDFKSLYPNLMIANNISPDTYVEPKESLPSTSLNIAPEVGHRFRKKPLGFYNQVLSDLISVRDDIWKKMKTLSPRDEEYGILDARQRAIKVITNACYGYAGWIGARWYIKPVAEATAAWGRATILSTLELAKKTGLEVIYGDTDSIFVKGLPQKIEKFSKLIEEKLGLEIKPDKVYSRLLFTEAKKRYAGLLADGRLDIVGLEVVRGDWASVAKNVQEKVLEIILKEGSPKDATTCVRQFISDLKKRKVPYRDLIIWKTLTKPLEEYEVKAPHTEAAKFLLNAGYKLTLGDKIGYVIGKGKGKLYEKARAYNMANYDEIDVDYYISNQILPPALRILELFQISKEEILKNLEVKEEA